MCQKRFQALGNGKTEVLKASRKDLPYLVSMKKSGATTVAATMIIAEMAGIPLFATGGVGGVHRGAETSFDISADLEELARTNVAVVCAGVKSILDLGLTKEYLETKGVPVIGYQVDKLPAFYTRRSKHPVDFTLNSPDELAGFLKAKWDMGLIGGALIANPIPEKDSMDESVISSIIEKALAQADQKGIMGKEVTPFLLSEIAKISDGESLEANIALVRNNAALAAKTALCLAKMG